MNDHTKEYSVVLVGVGGYGTSFLRRLLRDARGKHKLPVIYSMEEPRKSAIRPNPDGGKPIIGSLAYFTAAFGCHIAEYVIKEI